MSLISSYLATRTECSCGTLHEITTQQVDIGPEAIQNLGTAYQTCFSVPAGEITLFADRNTFEVAGPQALESLSKSGLDCRVVILEPESGHQDVEATAERVDEVEKNIDPNGFPPIAIGSGTVGDLVKLASFRAGLPFAVVGTALSMNGYASGIAAILEDGLKKTISCQQASLILLDSSILLTAPPDMTAAGVGDLLSKPVSHADWTLASLIRDTPYCPASIHPVSDATHQVIERVDAIAAKEPTALSALSESLVLSGFSMALAGSSSPASGGEHLISHYLDMEQHAQNQPIRAFHGFQVALGTRLSLELYRRLRDVDPKTIDIESALSEHPPTYEALRNRIERDHAHLPPPIRECIQEESKAGWISTEEKRKELEKIRDLWNPMWERLEPILEDSHRIAHAQGVAGCPRTPEEAGIPRPDLRRALLLSADMRNRYTILHFCRDLGLLSRWSENILETVFPD